MFVFTYEYSINKYAASPAAARLSTLVVTSTSAATCDSKVSRFERGRWRLVAIIAEPLRPLLEDEALPLPLEAFRSSEIGLRRLWRGRPLDSTRRLVTVVAESL